MNFDTSDLVKKAIKALDNNLKVTEIRIVVEGGSLDNVRDKESLEAGVAMTQRNTRTIHVTEAIGKGVTYVNDKFSTDIFTENTLRGKLGINAIEYTKSLYDLVVLDSMGTEKNFAESLEHEDDVVVYTKLPNGFYINTPMGKYNPDWAVAFKEGSIKHVYFVAESKGNDLQGSQLRGSEESKIECARRHFKAISDNGYIYDVAKN